MKLSQEILFFFSGLGVFNALIISVYLLFFKKTKAVASYFLGILLLVICVRISTSAYLYFDSELPGIYIQIAALSRLLTGPSLYYFTKAVLEQRQKTPAAWKFSYFLWIMVFVIIATIFPYPKHAFVWTHYIYQIIDVQWGIFVALCGWLLRNPLLKLFSQSKKLSTIERLTLSVFFCSLIVVHMSYIFSFLGFSKSLCISGALFFSIILYLNIPLFISRKNIGNIFSDHQDLDRYANKKISEEQALTLTDKLEKIILEQKLYKNPDLKLNDLAKKINISGHQLSQLLNDNLGKSFSIYINEYRISEACELIANDNAIKLEAIGYEVGFNSKSTFYMAFKKHKQTTPTLYREQLSVVY